MRYFLTILIIGLCLTGCRTTSVTPGTLMWYDSRMSDINNAYANKKLTTEQYETIKNDVDAIRVYYDMTYPMDPWTPPRFYRPHRFYHHR
jgi:hypothetical protein